MRADVYRDLNKSSRVFVDVVWPALTPILGEGSTYLPVEGLVDGELAKALDVIAGIDGFQIRGDRKFMRGVGTRVQWMPHGATPYNTFSIRVGRPSGGMTEKSKRILSVQFENHGPLFPDLTIQAYLRKETDELLSVGVVKTRDLYTCIEKHPLKQRLAAGNGGEQFEAYPFDYLQAHGCSVQTVVTTDARQDTWTAMNSEAS
jgi:hypothetical protein